MPNVGDKAPDFELLNQDGKSVKLSDFHGKKVILFAFPKADTPGCTTQACGFRDNFPKIQAGNAVVLGLSPDEPKDLAKWKKKENLPYDLLSDTEHTVLEQWGAWGEKSMYGKTYFGVIRSHWVIDENGVITDEQLKISPEKSVEKAVNLIG
ncbi:MAG: thioredoxin-dependent thiol peroxidase [Anaerolineae bacterium]|nr:thioredoxin-dependent thiol peroxidase [Anaerolineae bacterium]MBN8620945.1 thioredoxin-dependent thiol peroxidase [Anaerolineae bacterium]